MKSLTFRIASGLVVAVAAVTMGAADAQAQYTPPGGHAAWHAYSQQARNNWYDRREYYHGSANFVVRTADNVTNAVRTAVHNVRHTFGNPDYGFYDRYDRKPVNSRGPNPYGGVYAGYGYSNGYTNVPNQQVINRPVYTPPAYQTYTAMPVQQYRPTYGYGVNMFGR